MSKFSEKRALEEQLSRRRSYKFINAIKHPNWWWIVSIGGVYVSTLTPHDIRIVCLVISVIVAIATMRQTELAKNNKYVIVCSSVLFVVIALGFYNFAAWRDRKASSQTPPTSQVEPKTTITADQQGAVKQAITPVDAPTKKKLSQQKNAKKSSSPDCTNRQIPAIKIGKVANSHIEGNEISTDNPCVSVLEIGKISDSTVSGNKRKPLITPPEK
jgi:hypothetical protein